MVVRRKVARLERMRLIVVWCFLLSFLEEYEGDKCGLEDEDSGFVPLGSRGSEA